MTLYQPYERLLKRLQKRCRLRHGGALVSTTIRFRAAGYLNTHHVNSLVFRWGCIADNDIVLCLALSFHQSRGELQYAGNS